MACGKSRQLSMRIANVGNKEWVRTSERKRTGAATVEAVMEVEMEVGDLACRGQRGSKTQGICECTSCTSRVRKQQHAWAKVCIGDEKVWSLLQVVGNRQFRDESNDEGFIFEVRDVPAKTRGCCPFEAECQSEEAETVP